MQAYRAKTVVTESGTVTLDNLPFPPGEAVEILVVPAELQPPGENRYPLRGTPIKYEDPTAPVAEADWEAIR